MNRLKNYIVVETEDGSSTLYSSHYKEHCHSLNGAQNETLTHYIQSCQVVEKSKANKELNILEVGFGTGLGLKCTARALLKSKLPIHFISLEIDKDLIEYFIESHSLKASTIENQYQFELEKLKVTLIHGDAISTINQIETKFDCIYQDAFSPKKNPDLWSVEWFQALKKVAKDDCLMSTYSSSSSIRKSMIEAGWKLNPGQRFGKKRSSTIASINGESNQEILNHLERSPVLPLYKKDIPIFLRGELLRE